MDSMDMMFSALSNTGTGDVDKIKLTISKTADNQLNLKVKASPAEPPLDVTVQRPLTDDNTWMRHSMASLNQQIGNLQAEVNRLRGQIKHQVLAGYTDPRTSRWALSSGSKFTMRPILETVVDLSPFNLTLPPTTVMAQVYETRRGQVVGTQHNCAVSEITSVSFRVKVKLFRGRPRHAQKRQWHVYFMCAY